MSVEIRHPNLSWVIMTMEKLAPEAYAEDWDNVGLMIGDREQIVKQVLVALDYTDQVAYEAAELKADLVITHHPLIFKPIKSVTADTPSGRRILYSIKHNIAVYSAHTNLDSARGGTNDILFNYLGLIKKENLEETENDNALGRVGYLENGMTLRELATMVRQRLCLDNIVYVGDGDRIIKKVGICTGSAADSKYLRWAASKSCDTYITGDIKYHDAQAALEMGLTMIDATHYGSEVIVLEELCRYLKEEAKKDGTALEIFISKAESDIFKNISG